MPEWAQGCNEREEKRDAEINALANTPSQTPGTVPGLAVLKALDEVLEDDSIIIGDGGDFVASAAYTLRPRQRLGWLDPGVFGTLGIGGGFAAAAKCVRPDAEVWLLWGDGSCAWSLSEFDTMARHGLPVIALIGNDAAWMQILRGQEMLGSLVACELEHTKYEEVAVGYGGVGLSISSAEQIRPVLLEAKRIAREGRKPVCINAYIERSNFREGSISV